MAETATATETPGLLESALAFIKGETVPKSALLTAQVRVTELLAQVSERDSKITMLELARGAKTDDANLLAAQLKEANDKISSLEATAMTGARQAASILAKVGIDPVKATSETARDTAGEKTFSELVAEQVKAGKKQGEAIRAVMVSNPAAYQTYLKTGGKL